MHGRSGCTAWPLLGFEPHPTLDQMATGEQPPAAADPQCVSPSPSGTPPPALAPRVGGRDAGWPDQSSSTTVSLSLEVKPWASTSSSSSSTTVSLYSDRAAGMVGTASGVVATTGREPPGVDQDPHG